MRTAKLFVVVSLFALLVSAAAQPMSLCGYRSPETSLTDARLSFSYQYFDDANTPAIDVSTGSVDFSFSRLRDTEAFAFVSWVDGHVGLTELLPSDWLGEGAATFRYYVAKAMPLYGFGGLRAITATGQTQLGLEIRSGFGYGRFFDVTPLAKAMTIHTNLRRSKAIRNVLSDAVLSEIAQTIGGMDVTGNITDAVAAIEASIETAVGVQLDARSLLMIEEIATGSELQRFCGFTAQVGMGYELLDPYGGTPGFVVALSTDMAYAPDPSGQLEGHLSFSGPFDLANENTLTGSFSYEAVISRSSAVEAMYALHRIKSAGLAPILTHSVTCDLLFGFVGVDVLLGVAAARTTGDLGWSIGLSVSAALDLL